jgi:hypothetical protein
MQKAGKLQSGATFAQAKVAETNTGRLIVNNQPAAGSATASFSN